MFVLDFVLIILPRSLWGNRGRFLDTKNMKVEYNLTEDQIRLFEEMGTHAHASGWPEGTRYMFLPFWVEDSGDGHFYIHHLDNLPSELKTIIDSMRETDTENYEERI